MSYYYWFNRKDLFTKTHGKYQNKGYKEKTALHYQKNKEMRKKEKKTGIDQ